MEVVTEGIFVICREIIFKKNFQFSLIVIAVYIDDDADSFLVWFTNKILSPRQVANHTRWIPYVRGPDSCDDDFGPIQMSNRRK